uniref:Aluminum-activated malate transporter n=1 Tax=Leersia perrieri TaxID=77586 RepID=A0A0D9VJE2_9ORYZ
MDVAAREPQAKCGLEWRVTVPEGASVTVEHDAGVAARAWAWLVSCVVAIRVAVAGFARKVWKIGADDPRRAVHGLKVGLALTLVSVVYYTRPVYDGVGGNAMWAVMTVVVVFEYTVGGCMYKGFNRAVATVSAGLIALGVNWVADKSGDKLEPFILSGSLFLLAAAATFSRFIPTVKARFDYGVTIFILTFSLVAVSGYRVDQLLDLAQQRMSTIGIGIVICLAVCVLIWPVWAGQELHLLTVRNMEKLAGAVEACVEDYFAAGSAKPAAAASSKSEGYKCVLNSKASEDSQANLARWEPPHGRFAFRHPYAQYAKVGAAMRHCAYCVESLSSCARAEAQAPEHAKRLLGDVCTRLGARCARVLVEASASVAAMTDPKTVDFAVADMNTAVHELQGDLRALPPVLLALEPAAEMSLMDAMPLFTVASLLIEISARIEGVVDAVETLASLANFKQVEDGDDKKGQTTETKVHPLNVQDDDASAQENQTMKHAEQEHCK